MKGEPRSFGANERSFDTIERYPGWDLTNEVAFIVPLENVSREY
jgi:hypothetical protein